MTAMVTDEIMIRGREDEAGMAKDRTIKGEEWSGKHQEEEANPRRAEGVEMQGYQGSHGRKSTHNVNMLVRSSTTCVKCP